MKNYQKFVIVVMLSRVIPQNARRAILISTCEEEFQGQEKRMVGSEMVTEMRICMLTEHYTIIGGRNQHLV